jgi:hypothetical protein
VEGFSFFSYLRFPESQQIYLKRTMRASPKT